MRFSAGSGGLSTEKRSAVLVLVLFVDLILISSQIMLKSRQSLLQSVIANMVMPLQLTFQKASDFAGSELDRYVFLRGVFKKYQRLKQQHVNLRVENYALKRQLRDLGALAGVKRRFNRFRLANVISVDINFPYSSLVIDLGTRAGLVENDVVLNTDAELVGKITRPLTAFSAQVRLVTCPIGGTGAAIESNMLEGLLKGGNGAECGFRYLLANKPVRMGDRVITSGTDLIYPSYLPIGKVTAIGQDYLTQKITVRPFFVDKPIRKLVVLVHE
ncbi:MAG: rod shape-determining protein MreC [Acidobacteria bacterium]|jgi:cell shape-determining protein MreC|nr:rod shape-determining protein MreC [Acidobacteriota bacterium]